MPDGPHQRSSTCLLVIDVHQTCSWTDGARRARLRKLSIALAKEGITPAVDSRPSRTHCKCYTWLRSSFAALPEDGPLLRLLSQKWCYCSTTEILRGAWWPATPLAVGLHAHRQKAQLPGAVPVHVSVLGLSCNNSANTGYCTDKHI